MLFIVDPDLILDILLSRPTVPCARLALDRLAQEGTGRVAAASLPALRTAAQAAGPKATAELDAWLRTLPPTRTPSYVDFDAPLARADLSAYLVALSARAVGAQVLTANPGRLGDPELALTPEQWVAGQASPSRELPFCDLARLHFRLGAPIEQRLDQVFRRTAFINGPEVRELEERCAAYVGVKHAVGAASGTDALLVALMAYGVGPGDYVLTTPFTFIATAEVISLLGAAPVFVDVEAATANIDPAQVEAFLRHPVDRGSSAPIPAERIRGVIAVDLYGRCADYPALRRVLNDHDPRPFLLQDAAQSFGAVAHTQRAGSHGDVGTTSFFPAKPLGGCGDGGMLFTSDDALAKALREIVNHGQSRRYHHARLGVNGRLDTLQAAFLLAKLEDFEAGEIANRNRVANLYREALQPLAEAGRLVLPPPDRRPGDGAGGDDDTEVSAWAQFTVRLTDGPASSVLPARVQTAAASPRDRLIADLKAQGIPTAVHYPVPLHLQPAFRRLGYAPGDFPVAEEAARQVLSLPMDAGKTADEIRRVEAALVRILG